MLLASGLAPDSPTWAAVFSETQNRRKQPQDCKAQDSRLVGDENAPVAHKAVGACS